MLAATPYMGVDTWYGYYQDIDETVLHDLADAIVSTGMRDAGYEYVWLDSGWSTGRASDGSLSFDARKWPSGMDGLCEFLHGQGLKAGTYLAPTTGSDATPDTAQIAGWGFDALKVDTVNATPSGTDPHKLYPLYAEAIAAAGRPMLLNVCNFWRPGQLDGTHPSEADSCFCNYSWAPTLAQSWRTDTDVGYQGGTQWAWILRNMDSNMAHPEVAGSGNWNDPDYIVPIPAQNTPLTPEQLKAYMSMWVVMAAPLMVSANLTTQPPANIALFTNPHVIAINQDKVGQQGTTAYHQGDIQVVVKPLSGGSKAVCVLNRGNGTHDFTLTKSMIGYGKSQAMAVTDVWMQTTVSEQSVALTLTPTSCHLLHIS